MNHYIKLPETVTYILKELKTAGHSAYVVGGCVRDSLMGNDPSDWDICTDALPEQTLSALGTTNLIENGLRHGTVTVRFNEQNFEITTFRTGGEYVDNRHPKEVRFVRSIREDLSRRDFTINAMAYCPDEGLIDPFGGIHDLNAHIIRCVGDPDRRFNEDGLRLMRALRFSSFLCFTIEKNTAAAIHKNAALLRNISAERIISELDRLIVGPLAVDVMREYSDVIAVFIPEILPMFGFEQHNPHHSYDIWEHTLKVISFTPPNVTLRLTSLLHDIGKPKCFTRAIDGLGHFHGHPRVGSEMSADILRRLRYDRRTIDIVCRLVLLHDIRPPAQPPYVRRLLAKTGESLFLPLMTIKRADTLGQSDYYREEKLRYLEELERIGIEELKKGSAITLKELAVNGNDLKGLGITDGIKIGAVLKKLLDLVMDDKLENERTALLDAAMEFSGKQ